VAVVEAIPADEAVLVWTFLRTSNKWPDFPGLTEKALRQAGIDTAATIEAGGEPRRRIVVETFGRETASNAYAYCRNVVLLGCLEPSPQTLAGQFVAESRNLLAPVPADILGDLIRGEVYHRVYQAISRAACRRVSMDDQGRTQAEVTNVWLMSRHPHLRHDLGKVLPGARWEDWTSGIDEDALIGKTVRAAAKLEELLDEYEAQGVTKVGLKKPKGQVMKVVGHISNETFQIARSRAIEGRPWRLERQSLVYLGTKDTAQDDNPA
jgi:hypothetical protein